MTWSGSPRAHLRRRPQVRRLGESSWPTTLPEHRRSRIDPEALGAAAVFRFCESADESTRALGIRLIDRSPRFRLPEELFRLTESPDRRVRAFVIRGPLVRLYRDRGITDDWSPYIPPRPTLGPAAAAAAARVQVRGHRRPGAARTAAVEPDRTSGRSSAGPSSRSPRPGPRSGAMRPRAID